MSWLRNIALLPWWLLQLLTQAKSFQSNPLIGSPLANRLGLHVARYTLAHGLAALRRGNLALLAHPDYRRNFQRDGFLLVPNALPEDQFNALLQAVESWQGTARECHQGDTITRRLFMDRKARAQIPAVDTAIRDRRLQGLMRWSAGRHRSPLFHLERVVRAHTDQVPDPQRHLHSDTFHSTVKCWLYLDDVDDSNGTFTYVPGSHRFTRKRLRWEYAKSIQGRHLADRYARKGSLRVAETDLASLGLPPPVSFPVPANTLLIADTHGFHARGDSDLGVSRRAIFGYARSNPFDPWPGIGLPWVARLESWLMAQNLKRLDRRAARRGDRASWFQVVNSDFRSLTGADR